MTSRPRILVSNDDGIRAPGLNMLVEGLYKEQNYRLAATLYSEGSSVGLPPSVRAYSTTGFPADAVRLSFSTDVFEDGWVPDVVVSGMNRGLNAGRAAVVSGTVAAAREATLKGIKGMAVSLHSYSSSMRRREDYAKAVKDLMPIVNWFVFEEQWPQGVLLNMNFPCPGSSGNSDVIPGSIAIVPQGRLGVGRTAVVVSNPDGHVSDQLGSKTTHYQFRWAPDDSSSAGIPGTIQNDDFIAATHNFVTLTPMPLGPREDFESAMKLLFEWKESFQHPTLKWSLPN